MVLELFLILVVTCIYNREYLTLSSRYQILIMKDLHLCPFYGT